MTIDPFILSGAQLLSPFRSFEELFSSAEGRAALEKSQTDPTPWVSPAVDRAERSIAGPNGPVRVVEYTPASPLPPNAPTLVWAHGGGFFGGSLEMNEAHVVASELAARADARVLSVDYRLAVDGVRFPVPRDDVLAVLEWASDEYGVDAPLAVGGASAGANLAASSTASLVATGRRSPDLLVLAYPFLHFPVSALPYELAETMTRQLPELGRFHPPMIEHMVRNYVGRVSALPRGAMPGHDPVDDFPATTILISEYDDLRPSGELFAIQLREAGARVDVHLIPGMLHGFLGRTPSIKAVDSALDLIAARIDLL